MPNDLPKYVVLLKSSIKNHFLSRKTSVPESSPHNRCKPYRCKKKRMEGKSTVISPRIPPEKWNRWVLNHLSPPVRCPPGYKSVQRKCVNENECEWYPCINGGVCRDYEPPLRYECVCPKDFTGGHCELARSELRASRAFVIVVIVCLIILLGEYRRTLKTSCWSRLIGRSARVLEGLIRGSKEVCRFVSGGNYSI